MIWTVLMLGTLRASKNRLSSVVWASYNAITPPTTPKAPMTQPAIVAWAPPAVEAPDAGAAVSTPALVLVAPAEAVGRFTVVDSLALMLESCSMVVVIPEAFLQF